MERHLMFYTQSTIKGHIRVKPKKSSLNLFQKTIQSGNASFHPTIHIYRTEVCLSRDNYMTENMLWNLLKGRVSGLLKAIRNSKVTIETSNSQWNWCWHRCRSHCHGRICIRSPCRWFATGDGTCRSLAHRTSQARRSTAIDDKPPWIFFSHPSKA